MSAPAVGTQVFDSSQALFDKAEQLGTHFTLQFAGGHRNPAATPEQGELEQSKRRQGQADERPLEPE